MSIGSFWTALQWQQFNGVPGDKTQPGLLNSTIGPMGVAQQVFPTIITGNDNSIPADTIDLQTGEPTTGVTRSFATLRKQFKLFPIHVSDPALTMATNQVTLAAQALALVEDQLFFQGEDAQLPQAGGQTVSISPSDKRKLDHGLLGIAGDNKTITVAAGAGKKTYGLATYAAVVKGIAHFNSQQQGPSYALIVPPGIFADANLPLEDEALVTPASAIQPLLASGPFVMSAGLPPRQGLLAALGGKTISLYVGTGPLVEYNAYDGSVYSFTARTSIQFVSIDPRSLIKLEFEEIRHAAPRAGQN